MLNIRHCQVTDQLNLNRNFQTISSQISKLQNQHHYLEQRMIDDANSRFNELSSTASAISDQLLQTLEPQLESRINSVIL